MAPLELDSIRERVRALQRETAKLHAENQQYLSNHIHSASQAREHEHRRTRLQEIALELAKLMKAMVPFRTPAPKDTPNLH